MRLPCRRPPVYRPAKTFEQLTEPTAYFAFIAFMIAAIGILIATQVH